MRRWACNVWLFLGILCRNVVHPPRPVSDKEKTMFCTECGREFKEGAKFCEGCGNSLPQRRDTQKHNEWAMIVGGGVLIGLGLCITMMAAHDVRMADAYGEWWLLGQSKTLGEIYAYEAGGIVCVLLGAVVAILGIRKVI